MYSLVHWLKQEEIYVQQYHIYSVCACVDVSGAEKAHSFYYVMCGGAFFNVFPFYFYTSSFCIVYKCRVR